jgi:pimeloyl-ACP methyl ester carboxylesterase
MRPLDHRDGFELTFPASTVTVLRGVGHFVAAEAPDAVARAIADLVARG